MHVPTLEVHKAATLEEASEFLERFAPDVRLLAGGTDVLVDLKSARYTVGHLVALGAIKGLRGVARGPDGLRIGALTTITDLDRSPFVAGPYAAIRDATSQMATPQVRNAATVGGNVAGAVPCADLPPILIAMNASAFVWSSMGERTIAVEDLIVAPRQTLMRSGELLAAIDVPAPPRRFGAAYARFGLREANSIAVAGVAASVELNGDDTVHGARVVLCAVAPVPKVSKAAAAALVGRVLDDAACVQAAAAASAEAEPISDVRGSAQYRRRLVSTLTRRALLAARQRAGS